MLDFIKKILGIGPPTDYRQLLKEGGKIVDVRTTQEFSAGHIKGSINIPLHQLSSGIPRLDRKKAVILCCASGRRSGAARKILFAKGYERVYNGGNWLRLRDQIR
ncbi:MAG TPA: rhodanese-like domain-containing protein [Chryseosolibacter sp.]